MRRHDGGRPVDDPEFREFVQARHPEDLVREALLKVMRHWRRVDEPMPR